MKNQTQTVYFQANLLTPHLPETSNPDFNEKLKLLDETQDNTLREELKNILSKESKEFLSAINAELPTDKVAVSIKLGQFLYELLLLEQPEHIAPLQVALHKKYLNDLAVRLNENEFHLEPYETHNLKKILESNEKWAKLNVVALIEGNKQKSREIRLVSSGIKYFDQILNACVEIFLPTEKEKSKPKRKA